MNNDNKSTPTRVALNSGARFRKWRHKLAASSKRPKDSVRTLKFKLDFGDVAPCTFASVRTLNHVVDGTTTGSLTDLLLTIHASGFRVFPSETKAKEFRDEALLASSFTEEFCKQSGLYLPLLTVGKLRTRLTTLPRARGGKDISFVPDVIAKEYIVFFTGKPANKADPSIAKFFASWATRLHSAFNSEAQPWHAMKDNLSKAAKALDEECAAAGWVLPKTSDIIEKTGATAWPSSTLVFDPDQPILNSTGDLRLYQLVALRLSQARAGGSGEKELRSAVQLAMTTETSSGLSWLFGNGLDRLKESTPNEIVNGLALPVSAIEIAERLSSCALAIKQDPIWKQKSFAVYRRLVGGRLDSWVANYLNRLFELKETLSHPETNWQPPASLEEHWGDVAGRNHTSFQALTMLVTSAGQLKSAVHDVVEKMLGLSEQLPDEMDLELVENYGSLVSEAAAAIRVFNNQLTIRLEGTEDPAEIKRLKGLTLQTPDWLRELPAINKLSGAIPDFEQELKDSLSQFREIMTRRQQLVDQVEHWAENNGKPLGDMARLTDLELERHQFRRQALSREDAQVLAKANVLDRFARASFNCTLETREKVQAFYGKLGVFTEKVHANRFFVNQNGALYRSPYSRSRHQPYPLVQQVIESIDPIRAIGHFVADLAKGTAEGALPSVDYLKLQQAYFGLLLATLTDDVPRELADFKLPESIVRVPASLALSLRRDSVPADTFRRAFNLYHSALLAYQTLLGRSSFFVRARFQRVGDTTLHYCPKPSTWKVPARLRTTDKPIASVLLDQPIVQSSDYPSSLDVLATFNSLLDKSTVDVAGVADYLRQAPHDWCYNFSDGVNLPNRQCLAVDGKKGPQGKSKPVPGLSRLVGPSSHKGVLDKFLYPSRRISFGDITVIFDQSFTQSLKQNNEGSLDVLITPGPLLVSIAIPFSTDAPEPEAAFPLADRLVAIDQGEVGIGYAVYDVKSRETIDQGQVRIPSIRRLIKTARRYRARQQRNQKFQQRYDSTLFVMRENVVGDVTHAICNLMRRYRAFPVLESQVQNLEGGSRQLDLVYKALSTRFIYSDVQAHQTERSAYWQGANYWEHPYLKTFEWKDGQRTRKTKALNLFPGIAGPTAGTSQACSKCHRNPLKALSEIGEANSGHIEVKDGGTVKVADGLLTLYAMSDDADALKRYARRNERAPLDRPIQAKVYDSDEVRRIARRNLRRPPPSRQSKDTTQSIYQCLYDDCRNQMHADINAALNIGRRFLEERISDFG